jgi:hypothetical protein
MFIFFITNSCKTDSKKVFQNRMFGKNDTIFFTKNEIQVLIDKNYLDVNSLKQGIWITNDKNAIRKNTK